jgi:hypothetical protein
MARKTLVLLLNQFLLRKRNRLMHKGKCELAGKLWEENLFIVLFRKRSRGYISSVNTHNPK